MGSLTTKYINIFLFLLFLMHISKRNIIYFLLGILLILSTRNQRRVRNSVVYAPIAQTGTGSFLQHQGQQDIGRICFGFQCFEIETADTDLERRRGLMGRSFLSEGSGMLFVFPKEGLYPFWMKNTLLPLDMIWIDGSGRVTEIANATPCITSGSDTNNCPLYGGTQLSKYVLELGSGVAHKFGISVGSIVSGGVMP